GRMDRPTVPGEFGLGCPQGRLAPGADRHARPFSREPERNRPADPPATAGHDDPASLEFSSHDLSLHEFSDSLASAADLCIGATARYDSRQAQRAKPKTTDKETET